MREAAVELDDRAEVEVLDITVGHATALPDPHLSTAPGRGVRAFDLQKIAVLDAHLSG